MNEDIPHGTEYTLERSKRGIEFTISRYHTDGSEPIATICMTKNKATEFANHILDMCEAT